MFLLSKSRKRKELKQINSFKKVILLQHLLNAFVLFDIGL